MPPETAAMVVRTVNDRTPWLLLPVETKAREFHAKLLLAAVAVERGYQVVLGEQNAMVRQMAHLPRGLYVDKSIAATKTRHFQRLRGTFERQVAAVHKKGVFVHAGKQQCPKAPNRPPPQGKFRYSYRL